MTPWQNASLPTLPKQTARVRFPSAPLVVCLPRFVGCSNYSPVKEPTWEGIALTALTPQSRPTVRRMSQSEVACEIQDIEARRGSFESLPEKASQDDLTADERADMRRLDALRFFQTVR